MLYRGYTVVYRSYIVPYRGYFNCFPIGFQGNGRKLNEIEPTDPGAHGPKDPGCPDGGLWIHDFF